MSRLATFTSNLRLTLHCVPPSTWKGGPTGQPTWTDDEDRGEEANFSICQLQRVELGGHEEELIQELSHGHLTNHLTEKQANNVYTIWSSDMTETQVNSTYPVSSSDMTETWRLCMTETVTQTKAMYDWNSYTDKGYVRLKQLHRQRLCMTETVAQTEAMYDWNSYTDKGYVCLYNHLK